MQAFCACCGVECSLLGGPVCPDVQCVVWCGVTCKCIVEAGAGVDTTGTTRWWSGLPLQWQGWPHRKHAQHCICSHAHEKGHRMSHTWCGVDVGAVCGAMRCCIVLCSWGTPTVVRLRRDAMCSGAVR